MSPQLPELPEYSASHMQGVPYTFTAADMRAYAELAIASVKREPLSVSAIDGLLPTGAQIDEHDLHFFARAIEQAHGITATTASKGDVDG